MRIDSVAGKDLEELIGVPTRHKLKERYAGQYSYKLDSLKRPFLHGHFIFSYADSGAWFDDATQEYDSSMMYILKVTYRGNFENGSKRGLFEEQVLHDDGIDIFYKWIVTIDFNNNTCQSGTFRGAIGHIMPETTFQLSRLDSCTFSFVTDYAWDEWGKEFERQKNAR